MNLANLRFFLDWNPGFSEFIEFGEISEFSEFSEFEYFSGIS